MTILRRLAPVLLLAVVAAAQDRPEERSGPTEAQRAELIGIFGREEWDALPRWRQEMIEAHYLEFLRRPAKVRDKHARDPRALREMLLKPRRRIERDQLPHALRAELRRMPPDIGRHAARLAMLRLRQLRLDRGLRRVPREERWDLFRRLFPEPFDAGVAREAYEELRGHLKRDVKAQLVERMRAEGVDPNRDAAAAKRIFLELAADEERQVVARVRRELFQFKDADPRRMRRILEKRGHFITERPGFASPRLKELVRYCLAPHECPLLDPDALGPRPTRGAERQQWERDFQHLARLDLLFEAHLPREMVLHLAATGTPQDFLRALAAVRGAAPRDGGEARGKAGTSR